MLVLWRCFPIHIFIISIINKGIRLNISNSQCYPSEETWVCSSLTTIWAGRVPYTCSQKRTKSVALSKAFCLLFSINDHPRSIGLQLRVYEQGNKVVKNFTPLWSPAKLCSPGRTADFSFSAVGWVGRSPKFAFAPLDTQLLGSTFPSVNDDWVPFLGCAKTVLSTWCVEFG